MPITAVQRQQADQSQWTAARDNATQVRLVAGPGTGKSHTIEKRVADLLTNGVLPRNLYVISFTRATCEELSHRIVGFCTNMACQNSAQGVRVSTMHALALRILRRANLLSSYPSTPIMLDTWEQKTVYDGELASALGCSRTRTEEIRLAHDAQWQTLNPQSINQAQISQSEIVGFNAFHAARTNLYSCVLPGEVIYKCVSALQNGTLSANQLPQMDHLIVDEFQDLNACDQQFIQLLCAQSTVLFVAGDDDQSIYSFRHANPSGIVNFPSTYPAAATHVLTECFRCTPAILGAASQLIAYNPNRVAKNLASLYGAAMPPVQGRLDVWSFPNAQDEAAAIAQSCVELIAIGMAGREDEILILVSNRRMQLRTIEQALSAAGLAYVPPGGAGLTTTSKGIRAVYSILRITRDISTGNEDYPAYRDLLGVLSGVGIGTTNGIADSCIANNQNFRQLFHLQACPSYLTNRGQSALQRSIRVVQAVSGWTMNDTLAARAADITHLLATYVLTSGATAVNELAVWTTLVGTFPGLMTLDDLLLYLAADNESDRQTVLNLVNQRIGSIQCQTPPQVQKKIKMLTMHGAKGLSGKIVFIPGVEQGVIPSSKALQATGLLIEQRRLFYVSVTRAMAACIISHSQVRSGNQARTLTGNPYVAQQRSQFLNEMNVPSIPRGGGLTQAEASAIVSDVNNL